MPRRDATGSNGNGSITGRGLGNCNINENLSENMTGPSGMGRGNGCGRRGLGLNRFNRKNSSQDQKSEIIEEQKLLKMKLEELEKRLDSL